MKEENFTNSLYSFQQLKVEIEAIKRTLENKDLFSTDIYLLDEAEVIKALKISRSTFY